jgi:hypothetical protein
VDHELSYKYLIKSADVPKELFVRAHPGRQPADKKSKPMMDLEVMTNIPE